MLEAKFAGSFHLGKIAQFAFQSCVLRSCLSLRHSTDMTSPWYSLTTQQDADMVEKFFADKDTSAYAQPLQQVRSQLLSGFTAMLADKLTVRDSTLCGLARADLSAIRRMCATGSSAKDISRLNSRARATCYVNCHSCREAVGGWSSPSPASVAVSTSLSSESESDPESKEREPEQVRRSVRVGADDDSGSSTLSRTADGCGPLTKHAAPTASAGDD